MHNIDVDTLIRSSEAALGDDFINIDDISLFNQQKVLNAFSEERIALRHFAQSTGYGYDDEGRGALGRVFSNIFKAECAIVSPHILSGTHAITLAIFSMLRHGDTFLSISGRPYDTLIKALCGEGSGSLADYGIKYTQSDLLPDGKFDYINIKAMLKTHKPKLVFIQRSRGYSLRNPFSINQIEKACKFVKDILPECIILVDNCYGEFTEKMEPLEVGADLIAGSLIKNPGGGIAPNGGYVAGSQILIDKVNDRFTVPFLGREIGSNYGGYLYYFQGLFLAPHVTAQSLKGALLLGKVMSGLGYKIHPQTAGECYDLIRAIEFGTAEELIAFCQTIQEISPVDSFVKPLPWEMPGYTDQVIMAAGCFVQGSSIELSADGPLREPYTAYCQGGLTYEHVKLATYHCAKKLVDLKR